MAADYIEPSVADEPAFGPSAADVVTLISRIDHIVQRIDDLAARIEALEISPAERRKRELGELDRRIVDFLAAAPGVKFNAGTVEVNLGDDRVGNRIAALADAGVIASEKPAGKVRTYWHKGGAAR